DIVVVAKGLASGYMPISALLLSDDIADTVEEFRGGGSYGGHAAACAAALANLDIIEREGLIENARVRGAQFLRELEGLLDLDIVGDVHGIGLMLGVSLVTDRETREPYSALDETLTLAIRRDYGVILHLFDGTIILMPPLIVTEEEVTRTVQAIRGALERVQPDGSIAPLR
ncbi:MAG: aminotransferase class III-fold pyridoxal phosphate-dependent enzyme, partial [Leucobacter sp.]